MEIKDVRYRPIKYTKKIISKELYQKWIQNFPEYSKYSYDNFRKFWYMIVDQYKEVICTNSHGVRLPLYNGDISLKYVVSSDINRNYKSSNIAKEDVGHLNLVTSGKNGKVVWSIDYARKFNCELPMIGFQACRDLTTKAATAFKNTPELFRITKASKGNVEAILNKYHKEFYKK